MEDYKYKIIAEKDLIIEVYQGEITLDFLLECMDKEYNDPKYVDLKYGLCDLRNTTLKLSESEIIEQVKYARKHDKNPRINWATLTTKPHETAMAMIYEIHSSKIHKYMIFSTLENAANYLGIKILETDLEF